MELSGFMKVSLPTPLSFDSTSEPLENSVIP